MRRAFFMQELRTQLLARYGNPQNGLDGWAADPVKLDRFMARVDEMLTHKAHLVNIDSPSFRAAWAIVGGKGKPSYRALFMMDEAA